MSLTSGRGPLGHDPAGRFHPPIPAGVVYVEPFPRRVRGVIGSTVVVDSERAVLVHQPGHPPRYAFPADDVGAVASAPEPEAPGHVAVAWDAVEAWYEEEEQVFLHPRNPYHRIDCVPTTRHLRVEVAGVVLVDTSETMGLYETALAPRLYVPPSAVRMDLLRRSSTTSYCPYKGTASWWTAVVDGVAVDDVAWSYDDPVPESLPIRRFLCFDEQRATVVADLPRPG